MNNWNRISYLILILLSFLIQFSCETWKTDYREAFCGNYSFVIAIENWCIQDTISYDTLYYQGIISIMEGTDSIVGIRYLPGENDVICSGVPVSGAYVEPTINNSGILFYERISGCSLSSNFWGEFIGNDSIIIEIVTGGLGCRRNQRINGKRVN
jgi:hypothetical protein